MNFSYLDIQRLRVFFQALKDSGFKSNLNQIPSSIRTDCFTLLRKLPQFQTEEFKDDNILINAVNKYLRDPNKRKAFLSEAEFTQQQQAEFTQVLEEKPVTIETAGEQAGGGGQEQPLPVGESPSTMAGGGMPFPGMAAGGVAATPRRVIHVVRRVEEPKSKLYVANKSGRIIEERTITPTSSKVVKPEVSSKIAIADKSGNVIGERSLTGETVKPPAPPKLFIANKSGVVTEERSIKSASRPRFQTPRVPYQVTNAAKNLGSGLGRFTKLNSGRVARGFGNLLGGLGGAGRDALGGGIGIGGRAAGRFGNGAINVGARLSNQVGRGGLNLAGPKKKIWLLFLGMFGAFFLLTAFTGAATPPGGSIPVPGGGIGSGGNIASCQFTRADQPASYKSNLLVSYISEASSLTGIPPAVLAAFIRVESPGSVNKTDADLPEMAKLENCLKPGTKSPTGALGIMQIQPPGTTSLRGDPASCDDCIDAGAKLIGKTVSTMTQQDYCDPRTSIIVGSGWILKKMSKIGYPNTGTWDPSWTNDRRAIDALVNTYYGCLLYGGTTECTGPYNYGKDVYDGAQACKATTTSPISSSGSLISCPLSKDGSGSFRFICGTYNSIKNNCGHGNPSYYVSCTQPPYASCPFTDQLKAAADVRPGTGNGANELVYLPYVNGNQAVNWTKAKGPEPISGGADGYKVEYEADSGGKHLRLDLTHLNSTINTAAQQSGDIVSTTKAGVDKDGGGHLHTAISVDGRWVDSISEAHICTL